MELSELMTKDVRHQIASEVARVNDELHELFQKHHIHAAFCAWTDNSLVGEDTGEGEEFGIVSAATMGCRQCAALALAIGIEHTAPDLGEIFEKARARLKSGAVEEDIKTIFSTHMNGDTR